MISKQDLTVYVQRSLTDATVSVTDRTGTMDHFNIQVVSDMFKGEKPVGSASDDIPGTR